MWKQHVEQHVETVSNYVEPRRSKVVFTDILHDLHNEVRQSTNILYNPTRSRKGNYRTKRRTPCTPVRE